MLQELFKTTLGRLRVIGFLEGLSFLILLGIAMPLKYLAGMPGAVQVVGMIHGLLFIFYIIYVIQAKIEYNWKWGKTGLAMLASILPFGPFVADAKLFREEEAR